MHACVRVKLAACVRWAVLNSSVLHACIANILSHAGWYL